MNNFETTPTETMNLPALQPAEVFESEPIPQELVPVTAAEAAMEQQIPSMPSEATSVRQSWLRRHKGKLLLGIAGLSLATIPFTASSEDHVLKNVEHEAPYVVSGMAAMEALWIGGAVVAGAAVGVKVKNPLKIKQAFPQIAQAANESKVFKTGFWVNTAGAVGEFVIPAVAVCTKLPPESWGVLSPFLFDLGVTVAVRGAILKTAKANSSQEQPSL